MHYHFQNSSSMSKRTDRVFSTVVKFHSSPTQFFGASVSKPAMGEPVTAGAPWPIGDFRPCQDEFVEIFVRNSKDAEFQARMVRGKGEFVDISASGNGNEACFIKCSCGSGRVGKVGERW